MAHSYPTVDAIFSEALQRAPGQERAAYLDVACGGDAELRDRVERLLRAHGDAESFLELPAVPVESAPTTEQPLAEKPGTQIGPYKLLQQIGEGGMGIVYMAEQTELVQRKVALKVIKPGMDTRQVIARFEAERQALAMMDHVNIARVLDAGSTQSGQPYFVMELVHGVPITKYCDDHQLTPRERLELFVPVCQAIQHAHQKGIIHRDIKPSNVMVTLYDGKPVPKVIDFGVAKATEQRLTERTLFTQYGTMVGTLEYMSPEQAEMSALGVDTRGDIYSLGVLLYELLTGSTPLSRKRVREAAYAEILRMIKEEEPPKPSTRLSDSGEALASISAQRHTEPARLTKLVRGELDWIVMKALDKDRSRRYETANGFAADVLHYLADEPVLACPPSAAYRFGKFARRNKAALVTGGLVCAALVAAVVVLAVSNVLIMAERNAKAKALGEKVQALREKQTALGEKEAALSRAQANYIEAKRQEGLAQEQKQIATEQTALAKRRLYASQMNLAMQAWRAGDAPRVLELLEGQRPSVEKDDLRGFEWFYLWRLCNGGRLHLKGHTDAVLSLSYSPDGKTLASTGSDESIRLWDTATGCERMVLRKHAPWDVIFSPDGQILACGGKTTPEVTLWKAATGELLHKIPATVSGLAFSPDSRTLLGGGLSMRLWDVASGMQRATFAENGLMLGMLPDGKTVVTLNGQFTNVGEVRLWDAADGTRRLTIPFRAYTSNAALSPDGSRIATAAGGTVALWDSTTGQQLSTYPAQDIKIRTLAISPDGKRLAAAHDDRRVIVWDVETGKRIGQDVYRDVVWALAFSPDSKAVASASLGGVIKVWDLTAPEESLSIPIGGVSELRFLQDGKHLMVGHPGPTSVVDVTAGKEVAILPFGGVSAISADGQTAARVTGETETTFWDVKHGREIASFAAPASTDFLGVGFRGVSFRGVRLSPDGKQAATFFRWHGDNRVSLWDIATQNVQTLTIPNTLAVSCAEFSPDGKLVAAGFQFHWVAVWDVATGEVKLKFSQMPSMMSVHSLAFSPDSKALAVATDIGTVTLWDVESGQQVSAFRGHTSTVHAMAFSPDGAVLATAGADTTVRLWDVHTGQERSTLTAHAGQVSKVLFSPDGNTLATASANDGTVRLWRAARDPEALARRGAGSAPGSETSPGQSDPSLALPPTAFELTEAGLREAVRRWPDEVALHRRLGQLLLEQDRPADAEPALQEVVRLNPNTEVDYCNLAEVLRQQQKFAEAESAFQEALRLNPTLPWTHVKLGWLLSEQQKFAEAERAFREALRLKPDQPSAHHGLGEALLGLDRPAEAVTSLRELIRLAPTHRDAHGWLGWALIQHQQFAGAELAFREAVRLKPDSSGAQYGLAKALQEQEKFAEALVPLREAMRLEPSNPQWHDALGGILVEQAEFTQAELEYREVIRLKPDYAGGHFGLGRALVEQDKFSAAEAAVCEGLRLEPASHWGQGLLNQALVGQGKRPETEQPEMNDR